MYTHLLIVFASTACCLCYVNYEIFQGFAPADVQSIKNNSSSLATQTSETTSTTKEVESTTKAQEDASKSTPNPELKELDQNITSNETKINKEPSWSRLISTSFSSWRPELSLSKSELFQEENDTLFTNVSKAALKPSKFKCPEQESPSNIGPYEVPTQRDLVLHIRGTLTKMFNSYHEKALYFLKDISQATKLTKSLEKKCQGNKNLYRTCIKQVSSKCEFITKNLVTSLEKKRQDVLNLNAESICNLSEMKANPVKLIKLLAMEEASLEFALPGFLRLLHGCSTFHCSKSPKNIHEKPVHNMSDQEIVIRYFMI